MIVRPGISRPDTYWISRSSQLLSLYSTCGFCPHWADLWTPPLLFWRCTAPVKLRTWQCLRRGVYRSLKCHTNAIECNTISKTNGTSSCDNIHSLDKRKHHNNCAWRLSIRWTRIRAYYRGQHLRADAQNSILVPPNRISKAAVRVVVSHFWWTRKNISHLCCTSYTALQCQTRVKLNRVFFPR